jgi:hypothetical protein
MIRLTDEYPESRLFTHKNRESLVFVGMIFYNR